MPTVNLLPDGDVSNNWTLSAGSDVYALIDDDHSGFITADSSLVSTTASGKEFYVTLQDFTESHSAINSVTAVVRAGNNVRGQSFRLTASLTNSSFPITLYYGELSSLQGASAAYRTITYTARTTYDGSNAWTNALVNALRLKVESTVHSGGTLRCTYCYLIVDYTEPVATDNSIFFGTNF